MVGSVAQYRPYLAVSAFVMFAIVTRVGLAALLMATTDATSTVRARNVTGNLDGATKLLKALSEVTDSFAEAAPGIAALVASVLFAALAASSLSPMPQKHPRSLPLEPTQAQSPLQQ